MAFEAILDEHRPDLVLKEIGIRQGVIRLRGGSPDEEKARESNQAVRAQRIKEEYHHASIGFHGLEEESAWGRFTERVGEGGRDSIKVEYIAWRWGWAS